MQVLHLIYLHWFLSTILIGSATRGVAVIVAALRGTWPGNAETYKGLVKAISR